MEITPVIEKPPKKPRRKGVHKTNTERLEQMIQEMPEPTYQATDDDLPLVFWPDEDFNW